MSSVADHIDIYVSSRTELDQQLEDAVKKLQGAAARTRTHGILATRQKPGFYTVSLSAEVPYGTTREQFN